jgi:hypothetical protein
MTPTCALPGCSKPLPPLAILHDDPWCSSTCARIGNGLETAKPREYAAQKQRRCSGCGCAMEESTEGCDSCRKRRVWRRGAIKRAA